MCHLILMSAIKSPLKQISDILLLAVLGRSRSALVGHLASHLDASKQSPAGPQRLECIEVGYLGPGGFLGWAEDCTK